MNAAEFLRSNKIELYSLLDFNEVTVTDANKLQKYEGFTPKSVLVLAVPYLAEMPQNCNISLYAHPRDYHLFFRDLFSDLTKCLLSDYPTGTFISFADSSPLDERHAAAIAGLGVIGKNGLLITEKYGSYVFIGEIISDIAPELFGLPYKSQPVKSCMGCGVCKSVCPADECGECLSAITQKKGELSQKEMSLMLKHGTAWGCDICQRVCPHNKKAELSPIEFFGRDLIHSLDQDTVNNMTKEEFKKRAWSWRGKTTILRNLALFERVENDDNKS